MPSNKARAGAPNELLEFERVFEAPAELVFRIWSDPAHIVRWWGPEGYGLAHCEMEFEQGGSYRYCLKQVVTGFENWVHGTYHEIAAPHRLRFSYVNEDDGHETMVDIAFAAEGGRTRMRFKQSTFPDDRQRDAHGWGWNSTFDLLAAYLSVLDPHAPVPSGRPRSEGLAPDIVAARRKPIAELEARGRQSRPLRPINTEWHPDEVLELARTFDAPASLIFKVLSDPEHMVRWVGPEGHFLVACEVDFRVGGRWMETYGKATDPDYRHTVYGTYREIDVPRRIAMTYTNDYNGIEMLVTMDFRELGDGRTELQIRQVGFPSVEERDGHGWGWRTGLELLAAYLAVLDPTQPVPIGQPRRDGVAEDIIAARQRHEEQKKQQRVRE